MMPLRIVVASAVAAACMSFLPTSAWADLTKGDRESTPDDAKKAAINTYVTSLVAKISANDATSGKARDELASQCNTTPAITPSAAFKLVYAQTVSTSVTAALKNPEMMVRLNLGIAVHRLSISTTAASLEPAVTALLNDQSDAVRLWGVKSVGPLLPTIFGAQTTFQNEKITAALVAAVQKPGTPGPIIEEAFKALDLSAVPKTALAPGAFAKSIDRLLEICNTRITQYVNGVPTDPQFDVYPTQFLPKTEVRSVLTKPQLTAAMQTLVELLAVTAERGAALGGADRARILRVTERAAGGIFALSNGDKTIGDAIKPFTKSSTVPQASPKGDLVTLLAAVRALPDFKTIKEPREAVTTPASASGTGTTGG